MKLRRTGLRSLWDLPMPQSSQGGRGEEVPPGTSRLYFFWPPCQPRLNVYTSSSSLLLLHCCLSASIPQGMGEGGVEGMGGVEKSWRGKDKKKERQIKWQHVREREKEAKRELNRVPQALKASELFLTSDIISISFFWAALLSIESCTDTLWFLSLHADTTVSDPVWSTFWFRDESHRSTLKCTAPTLCPVDPELIMTVGTAHPPNTTPTSRCGDTGTTSLTLAGCE